MSNKKSSKKKGNNFPYSNEIKKAKDGFKKMIDEMSDEEFMIFSFDFLEFMLEMSEYDDNFEME